MPGMKALGVQINDGTGKADEIEQCPHVRAEHQKADAEQKPADHLKGDHAVFGFLLEGENVRCHGGNADDLRDDLCGCHDASPFLARVLYPFFSFVSSAKQKNGRKKRRTLKDSF